jgi:hypothetical protein
MGAAKAAPFFWREMLADGVSCWRLKEFRRKRTANKTEKREKQLAMEAAMRAMSN